MNKIIFLLTALIIFNACSNQATEQKPIPNTDSPQVMTHRPSKKESFKDVVFADKFDLVCGMPLTAGLTDTVHYKNGVYGFCSPECKAEFIQAPDSILAAKKGF